MPVGPSGRIVVDVGPELKREIHAALKRDGLNMKQWFLLQAQELLQDRSQLSLDLSDLQNKPTNRPCG